MDELRPSALAAATHHNRRRDPVRAEAELAMARVLAGVAGPEALRALSEPGIAAATSVLSAFASSDAPFIGPSALDALEITLERWSEHARRTPEEEARFLSALSRLSPLRALSAARERLSAEAEVLSRAAARALGRAGREPDVAGLLALAAGGPPRVRVAALEAAHRICTR